MSRPTKIAIIGARGFNQRTEQHDVQCFPWNKLHRNQNFKDYDVIVISLLGADGGKRINGSVFNDVWNADVAAALLESSGTVYVIGDPRFDILVSNKKQPFLDWSKAVFTWHDESGDTVVPNIGTRSSYQSYLEHARSWSYCLDDCSPSSEYWNVKSTKNESGETVRVVANVSELWSNRYERPLAFVYWPVLEVTQTRHRGAHTSTHRPTGIGNLVLLPPTDLTEEETIRIVLRDILSVPTSLPEPEWVTDVVAPGQAPLDAEIERMNAEFDALVEMYKGKVDERSAARESLRLLYDEGHSLEVAIYAVLRSLGANVEEPPEEDPNHEDGWITTKYGEGVLEIKGTTRKQHPESGLRQLGEWQHRGRVLRQKKYKPIFIGSSSRETPVAGRPQPFSDGWRKAAALQEVCAIRAEDLYAIYAADQNGQLDRDAFWQAVFTTDGIFDAAPYVGAGLETMDATPA